MDWIPVEEKLPEDKKWVCVQTQDGSVFPAKYDPDTKRWSPVFRGGEMDSLMHGKVLYWQPAPTGFPYLKCDRGHCYLKTPGTTVCPICKHFGFVLDEEPAEEASKAEEPVVESAPVEEPVEEAPVAEPATEETPAEKPKRSRKKPTKA